MKGKEVVAVALPEIAKELTHNVSIIREVCYRVLLFNVHNVTLIGHNKD